MKVLQVNVVCGSGSTGRIAVDLHKALIQSGCDSMIAYGRGSAPKDIKSYRIGSDFSVRVHAALSRFTDRQGLYSKKATRDFLNVIDEFNPDIIHLHNIHGYYINYKILFDYLKVKEKKVVWTLHDCWPFTGHCSHFDYVDCLKWHTGCYSCEEKNTYPKSILLDSSSFNYKIKKTVFSRMNNMTLVVPSHWLANLLKDSFLKDYPVKIIRNGVDTEIFRKRESDFRTLYNLENKKIILGVASVWSKRKGLDDFIKLAEFLEDDFKIVLVGLSKKQAKNLPKNILGIEKTENMMNLAEIYSISDVFFNPTYADNYPTTNLEALACGTPVITYDTGGSSESATCIIKKQEFGNVTSFLKEPFSKTMLRDFDKKIMTDEYLNIYKDL
jgi:glycosyltransferase involved in cell wall biosynthesis